MIEEGGKITQNKNTNSPSPLQTKVNHIFKITNNIYSKIQIKIQQLILSYKHTNTSQPTPQRMIPQQKTYHSQRKELADDFSDDFQLSRRKNQVQEEDSNITVYCRIKPLHHDEDNLTLTCNSARGKTLLTISDATNKMGDKSYYFTKVFRNDPQAKVIDTICSPIVADFNAPNGGRGGLIFSYGVTNSGKSYTILGTKEDPGVLHYVCSSISTPFFLTPYEVYNNEYYCLLTKQKLVLKTSDRFEFKQYTPFEVTDQNIHDVLTRCNSNRKVAESGFNSSSSRSHAVFKIQKNHLALAIVDLAGSERNIGQDKQEQISINKSLLTLGRCLKALKNREAIIPIRENALTRGLAEYFNSYSNIVMIVNINPIKSMLHQTTNALEYGNTAVQIRQVMTPLSHSRSVILNDNVSEQRNKAYEMFKSGAKPIYKNYTDYEKDFNGYQERIRELTAILQENTLEARKRQIYNKYQAASFMFEMHYKEKRQDHELELERKLKKIQESPFRREKPERTLKLEKVHFQTQCGQSEFLGLEETKTLIRLREAEIAELKAKEHHQSSQITALNLKITLMLQDLEREKNEMQAKWEENRKLEYEMMRLQLEAEKKEYLQKMSAKRRERELESGTQIEKLRINCEQEKKRIREQAQAEMQAQQQRQKALRIQLERLKVETENSRERANNSNEQESSNTIFNILRSPISSAKKLFRKLSPAPKSKIANTHCTKCKVGYSQQQQHQCSNPVQNHNLHISKKALGIYNQVSVQLNPSQSKPNNEERLTESEIVQKSQPSTDSMDSDSQCEIVASELKQEAESKTQNKRKGTRKGKSRAKVNQSVDLPKIEEISAGEEENGQVVIERKIKLRPRKGRKQTSS